MARKKGLRDALDRLSTRARSTAADIYKHAGSFLIRTVCDEVAALLRELADQVDELDGENSRLKWDLTKADEEIKSLQFQIDELDSRLRSYEVLPPEDVPTSTEGLTGGQGFTE